MFIVKSSAGALAAFLTLGTASAPCAGDEQLAYFLKTGSIYELARFAGWPAESFDGVDGGRPGPLVEHKRGNFEIGPDAARESEVKISIGLLQLETTVGTRRNDSANVR